MFANIEKFEEGPLWALPSLREQWDNGIPAVIERFKKLEQAAMIKDVECPVSDAEFAAGCAFYYSAGALDSMSAEEIAHHAAWLGSMKPAENLVDWAGAIPLVDARFVTNDEWTRYMRILGIGGSEVAPVFNMSPFSGAMRVWHDKTHGIENRYEDIDKRFIFGMGHAVEDVCIQRYCDLSGAKRILEPRMFQSKRWPMLTANVDGILRITDNGAVLPQNDPRFKDGELYVVFEAKTANIRKREHWREAPPDYYVTQCRHYMGVLDDPRIVGTVIGCVFDNTPGDCVFHFIPRDAEAEVAQCEYLAAWWNRYVVTGKQPPLSGKPGLDREVIKNQPMTEGEEIQIEELDSLCALYERAKEYRDECSQKLREADDYMSEVSFVITQRMGTAQKLNTASYTAERKVRKGRVQIDANTLGREFPEAYEKCAHRTRDTKEFVLRKKKKS